MPEGDSKNVVCHASINLSADRKAQHDTKNRVFTIFRQAKL
jgi:hypothetical protein